MTESSPVYIETVAEMAVTDANSSEILESVSTGGNPDIDSYASDVSPYETAGIDEYGFEVTRYFSNPEIVSTDNAIPLTESGDEIPAHIVVTEDKESSIDLAAYTSRDMCTREGIRNFKEGRYFIAIKLFKRALRFKPNDSEANYWVGYCYLMTNDLEKAEWFLKLAIVQKHDYDLAYLKLGDTLSVRGDLNNAWMNGYKIAFDLNPTMFREKVLF
jgi:tetratricopeptide (TPR) repeat protein